MTDISHDELFMEKALQLAKKGLYTTTPNPRVGCVIVKDRIVVGEGFHEFTGKDHAEIIALNKAGTYANGSTVYVTMEPCCFIGKTGACSKALINAGVSRIVIAMIDPNPLVNKMGISQLRDHGIEVKVGVLEKKAIEINVGFIKRMSTGMPWVRAKMAASIDGFSALKSGESKWITSEESRNDGHKWRARSCAIITGIGTIKRDNPRLSVRAVKTKRQPIKIVVDPTFEVSENYKVFDNSKVIIATINQKDKSYNLKKNSFIDKGIEIIEFEPIEKTPNVFKISSFLHELGKREFNELHLEAGSKLLGSFYDESLIDEFVLYLAPKFFKEGIPLIKSISNVNSLSDVINWKIKNSKLIGKDLRLILQPHKNQ